MKREIQWNLLKNYKILDDIGLVLKPVSMKGKVDFEELGY